MQTIFRKRHAEQDFHEITYIIKTIIQTIFREAFVKSTQKSVKTKSNSNPT